MAQPVVIDRTEANLAKLKQADEIQDKTREAIWRIQRQAAEAEELGAHTLDELRRQGNQMEDINSDLEAVGSKLDTSRVLQTKFDAWAGNWLGGKRRQAMNEAAAENQARTSSSKEEQQQHRVKEVFQHEKYDSISRTWKRSGLVLITDPSISCNDVFDPATAENVENSRWIIDFSMACIDADGWTYSFDFASLNKSGAGDQTPRWNSYVRRRKWRYVDRSSSVGAASSGIGAVSARNDERKVKKAAAAASNTNKIGYVPRNKQAAATSGLGSNDSLLDADSAAGLARLQKKDADIDAGIDSISRTIDNLASIGAAMKDEVNHHNQLLDTIEGTMQRTTEKNTVVNARQRYLLK